MALLSLGYPWSAVCLEDTQSDTRLQRFDIASQKSPQPTPLQDLVTGLHPHSQMESMGPLSATSDAEVAEKQAL